MTVFADGGWLTAILILLLALLGFFAYWKRWRKPKLRLATVGGAPAQENQPEPVRASTATPSSKSSGSKLGGQAPYWAIAFVLVTVLVLLIARFAPVVGDGILEVGFGDRIIRQQSGATAVQPARAEPSEAERHANAVAERNRIESEPHDPILRYGVREAWIRVPDGGFVTVLQHVEHNRVVGEQCSSSVDKPPADATGEQYNCVSGVVARWVRYSYWGDDAGPVRIHYRFHYAF